MLYRANLGEIVGDRFKPYVFRGDRKLSVSHVMGFLGLPVLIVVLSSIYLAPISAEYQAAILAVFAVVAAVLTSLLGVVHAIVNLGEKRRKYSRSQKALWSKAISKLHVLRELYTAICYDVVILVLGLLPAAMLAGSLPDWVRVLASGFVVFVASSVAISFLTIVQGVYLVLDIYCSDIEKVLQEEKEWETDGAEEEGDTDAR